jgi:hypothetical protein
MISRLALAPVLTPQTAAHRLAAHRLAAWALAH